MSAFASSAVASGAFASGGRHAGDRAARALVWGAWAVLLAVALAAVARWGRDIPLAEDWLMVAPLTGHEPDLGAWLWAQNNEHRVPLPKLLYLGLLRASGGDFRVGMLFNVLALAGVAAAMIVTARALRHGETRATDAFFPMLFLHLGNWTNLVWSWQIQFVTSALLVCALLLVVVRQRGALGVGSALLAGTALALLPLTGAIGIVMALALSPWAVASALHARRGRARGGRLPGSLALLAGVAAAGVVTVLYFVGYERPTWNAPGSGLAATLATTLKFLALGFGPAAYRSWAATALLALVVLAPTALLLARGALAARGDERPRAWGLFLFAGGMAVLALAIGWGRSGAPLDLGALSRYALFSAPALCAAYFAWELEGGRVPRRVAHAVLALGMLVMLPLDVREGLAIRDWYVAGMTAVERDLAAGAGPAALAARHRAFLLHWNEAMLASRIRMLRDARLGPFARAAPDAR